MSTDAPRKTGDDFIRDRIAAGTLMADPATGKVFVKRGPKNNRQWEERVGWTDPDGYLRIGIGFHGDHRLVAVHRVVLIFAGVEIPAGMEPDHINRDPSDNRLENLRVVTQVENLRNRRPVDQRGSKNPSAKLDEDKVRQIRSMLKTGLSHSAIARSGFNVTPGLVSQIATGKIWSHVA